MSLARFNVNFAVGPYGLPVERTISSVVWYMILI